MFHKVTEAFSNHLRRDTASSSSPAATVDRDFGNQAESCFMNSSYAVPTLENGPEVDDVSSISTTESGDVQEAVIRISASHRSNRNVYCVICAIRPQPGVNKRICKRSQGTPWPAGNTFGTRAHKTCAMNWKQQNRVPNFVESSTINVSYPDPSNDAQQSSLPGLPFIGLDHSMLGRLLPPASINSEWLCLPLQWRTEPFPVRLEQSKPELLKLDWEPESILMRMARGSD